ncbi:MAG: SLC13 family permease, partial [Cellulosilyticaceae bacterium]
VLGVFLCTIYLWSFVDTIWGSLFGIVMLGFTGFMPMNTVITTAFGNPLAIMILYVIILTGAITHEGVCDYIARWFVTRKIINGKPWVFTFMIFLGAFILSSMTLTTATIFIFWPILYSMFAMFGIKKGDQYATQMLVGIVMSAVFGFASTPFKGILPGLLRNFEKVTGLTIEYLPYMAFGIVISLLSMVGIVLLMKYVFKPNVAPIQEVHTEMFNKNPLPPMNRRQKILVVGLLAFIGWVLLPSLLPAGPIKAFFGSSQNGIPILVVIFCCMIKVDGKPVIDYNAIVAKYMSWSVVFIVAAGSTVVDALTAEETGITLWLQQTVTPLLEGKTLLVFTIIMMVLAIILTNVCNNMVIGMLFIPIIFLFTQPLGISPTPVTVMILYVICLAIVTPAGSATAAVLHGNRDWLTPKDIYKYTIIISLMTLLITFIVGQPLVNILF